MIFLAFKKPTGHCPKNALFRDLNLLPQMAVIAGTLASFAFMPLYTFGMVPSVPGLRTDVSIWCLCFGLLVFLLVFLMGRPQKMVFIDQVCLNEGPLSEWGPKIRWVCYKSHLFKFRALEFRRKNPLNKLHLFQPQEMDS